MPLSKIQTDIMRLLASQRDPESYVAGSKPRDVFHDREERVGRAAQQDGALLEAHGYTVQWLRREPAIYALLAGRGDERTKLESVVDSDFRFFPILRDERPRDAVDLVTIHERILPLGAVVWASAGKAPGFTPEGIIDEIRRTARYTDAEFRLVASDPPLDPATIMTRLREILREAVALGLGCRPPSAPAAVRRGSYSPTTGRATPTSAPPCSIAGRTRPPAKRVSSISIHRWIPVRLRAS